ncbi:MAG: class I SAM-dependent methyltransferase [Endozoicomonas sp. (ex Botrylloides leachii)]|nr:class I SAM-dependent methyltransferase [Endozoicomonas sp. (ex Botrylloides leachii)]
MSLFIDSANWSASYEQLKATTEELGAVLIDSRKKALPVGTLLLCYTLDGLALRRYGTKESAIIVDFVKGKAEHRRKFGGGKGQHIAKAVGIHNRVKPSVLDSTGGLGRDAFVFASLGCQVTLIERSPVIAALLEDGLKRAVISTEVAEITSRMHLIKGDSIEKMHALLEDKQSFDVVYLDPMFPQRNKSALVKKEMRLFQDLLGEDADADRLLEPALALARHRVVIKRLKGAPDLAGKEPIYRLKGKSCRYDIHALKSFNNNVPF